MQKIATTLTFIMVSFLSPSWASDSTPSPSKDQSSAKNVATKKAWMENIQNTLPGLLCNKDQHFMTCFSVTEKECVDFNKLFVQACLNNVAMSLPAELNPQEGKHWGAVMGKCSYDLFEKFLHSKKLAKPECGEVKKDVNKETKKETKKEIKKETKKEQPAP